MASHLDSDSRGPRRTSLRSKKDTSMPIVKLVWLERGLRNVK